MTANADIGDAAKVAQAISQANGDRICAKVSGGNVLLAVVVEISDRQAERLNANCDFWCATKPA
jgi:hypothetical protein